MALLPWVWYGGAAGVAVLYSVVVGDVREFWVKTATSDIKVAEFTNSKTYTPFFSWGDSIGDSFLEEGTFSFPQGQSGQVPTSALFGDEYLLLPPGTSTQLGFNTTAQLISQDGPRVGNAGSNLTTAGRSSVGGIEGTASSSNSATTFLSKSGFASTTVARRDIALRLTAGIPQNGSITFSGTIEYTINTINSSTTTTPYEAWISADKTTIYVTIKYLDDVFAIEEGDPQTENKSFDTVLLITLPLSGESFSSQSYSLTDSIPPQPDNWRESLNNFRRLADTPPTGLGCVDDYRGNGAALLLDEMLYIVGATEFTSRTATGTESCQLGDLSTGQINVPVMPTGATLIGQTFLLS